MKTVKSKDGTKIAYDVFGSGPALIFITGAICSRNFMPVLMDAKVFGTSFSVYNYDRRGRGDSADTIPYSIDREVEDIEALIDAAGGSAFVYGHSSGAVLALEAGLKLPSKVKKIFMYDAAYAGTELGQKEYLVLVSEVNRLIQSKKNAAALRKFIIGIGMPKVFAYLLPLMPGWKTMKALAPTLEYDMLLTKDLPPLERASKLSVPAKIAYGEKSPESMHIVAKKLAQSIPKSEVLQVSGQDHMVSAKILLPLFKDFFN